jgi:hypothetical protein
MPPLPTVGGIVAVGVLVLAQQVLRRLRPTVAGDAWLTTGERIRLALCAANEGAPQARQQCGMLLDAAGQTHPANTPLEQLDAVMPEDGVVNGRTPVVFVNGIVWDPRLQQDDLRKIATSLRRPTLGLCAASENIAVDLWHCLVDKLGRSNTAAVQGLATVLVARGAAGLRSDLIVWSRGALLVNLAVRVAREAFRLMGYSPLQAREALAKVSVEVWGGAATRMEDGPNYLHLLNEQDPLTLLGQRAFGHWAGEGAKRLVFRGPPFPVGHMPETYLPVSRAVRAGQLALEPATRAPGAPMTKAAVAPQRTPSPLRMDDRCRIDR